MKVKDLIEELKKYPEDLEVVGCWEDNEYGYDISQELDLYTTTVKILMVVILLDLFSNIKKNFLQPM